MSDHQIHFTLPKHAANARALGYACGLSTGIATPHLAPGKLPEEAPFRLKPNTLSTNDPHQFGELFREGVGAGLLFGRQASRELAEVLAGLPFEQWWPVSMYFAGDLYHVPEEKAHANERVQQGVTAFRKIYQRHLS